MSVVLPQYDVFFELTNDLVCVAGYDGYFKKVNPAVQKVLGYSYEELYDRPIHEFIYQEDKAKTEELRNVLLEDIPLTNFENRYVTKSGKIVWLSWSSQPFTELQIVFAIAKNITQTKELESDRNSLLANLTELNKDLRHIGYMTSHDLRAPINNLLSIYELLDFSKITDKETLELMQLFKISCEELRKKLDVYAEELQEKHSLYVPVASVSLNCVLNTVTKSINNLVKNVDATIIGDFEKVPKVISNSSYLESIFLNLISNSIKYKKVTIKPIIHISSELKDDKVHIVFTDNGLGFDLEKVKNKIFGFQQSFHNTTDSRGIGLYLVYNHVMSLNGKIEVESEPNEGSTFRIILNP